MNSTQYLLDFTQKIEGKNVVSAETAVRIRKFIHKLENASPWELFMIISGIMGALFASAGIFAIISHNWDDFPKHIRGALSIVPSLVGLYFYYLALFKHKDSKVWIESSSMFLMLMIGASIALVSQTYQMDGDFNKFIKVWAALTVPLFYFGRASGITLLYFILTTFLLVEVRIGFFGIPSFNTNENFYWFWIFFAAFLPHYYLHLNTESNKQSIRMIYLSYCLFLAFYIGLGLTVKSNYLLWHSSTIVLFYLLGKKFMGGNSTIFGRPFQLFANLILSITALLYTFKPAVEEVFAWDSFFNYPYWWTEQKVYFFALLPFLIGIYFIFFMYRKSFEHVNYLIVFAPALFVIAFVMEHASHSWWMLSGLMNLYVLALGIAAMIVGSDHKNTAQMAYGLILICILLWWRYFDTSWHFVVKGLVFLAVGGGFFLINGLVKGKVEEIERHKNMKDEE